MKIFSVIFFSLIFTVFLFLVSLTGMALLYSEIYHIQDCTGRLKDIFFPGGVSIFVSIWFIYIIVKIGNIRKEEEKQILEEERKAHELAFESKKIAEEKIRKEKEKAEDKRRREEEKQQAEEYARRQAESDRLSGERIAAQKAEEKRRKEEEKQNNGYYIEIDTNGKTEITGPFEEKKIKDLFEVGKLNLTSKIKKGVKTKSFSSLSTFKDFTKGLDDWL